MEIQNILRLTSEELSTISVDEIERGIATCKDGGERWSGVITLLVIRGKKYKQGEMEKARVGYVEMWTGKADWIEMGADIEMRYYIGPPNCSVIVMEVKDEEMVKFGTISLEQYYKLKQL